LKNMLANLWWCKTFWDQILKLNHLLPNELLKRMNNAWVGGDMKSHDALSCWKKKMLLLIHAKVSKRKGCWSTINLVAMIEVTRAHSVIKLLGRWWLLIRA
jgi:hypothetical protein